ncbi:hypothetical protein SLEP1_g31881 [Rubroshorea leprosula]|uniref:Mitochondrial inner membrane protease subunit 2 n=1 Tax=Rubroshorea leprosula TaxID=152421 RepID=A0AAV5KBK5_9ROSI|nr:hypothetical protein SLEP1_g31881 [Rubroshorea leprosula]
MGTYSNFLWSLAKKSLTAGLIAVTISDRLASISPVHGYSMSPTLNPKTNTLPELFSRDYVLMEKLCLQRYRFSHGDVVAFSSPENYKQKLIKRIIGLPGDWVAVPHSYDVVRVPEGHCWVEGDNSANSKDSRSLGPIPLGLICGRATHIVWPPRRISKLESRIPQSRLSSS